MTDKPTPEETTQWQKRLASQANDRAWTLTEQDLRSAEEDEEMLQAAHTSMYCWKIVGTDRNHAHAAQLLAHVYALLGLAVPATYYHVKSSHFFESSQNDPWETALAHAVSANVAYASENSEEHRENYRKAEEIIQNLAEPEDKRILNATLCVVPKPGNPSSCGAA